MPNQFNDGNSLHQEDTIKTQMNLYWEDFVLILCGVTFLFH